MKLKHATDKVYVRSMRRLLRVTAIFTDKDEANDYMEKTADEGVVAEFGPYIMLADLYDKGTKVAPGY